MGARGHKTQMFKGQGGHKTKTAKGHSTLDFLDSEGQGTQNWKGTRDTKLKWPRDRGTQNPIQSLFYLLNYTLSESFCC